jgi:hypothetical protein
MLRGTHLAESALDIGSRVDGVSIMLGKMTLVVTLVSIVSWATWRVGATTQRLVELRASPMEAI